MASGSKKVIIAALIGNGLISITKFIASTITGSSAMMSEGVHSLVDTGNQVLLLYGLKQSKKKPDVRFPFGHGKEIYFWSFVVSILIFAVGAGVSLYDGIYRIQHPGHIENPNINYIVLAFAIVFEGFALGFALKEFNKARGEVGVFQAVHRGKDPTLFVVLFEDSAAMLGLFVAFFGVFLSQVTGNMIFDGIASVVIGLILGITAIWLAYETKGLLIGEAAKPEIVDGIKEIIKEYPGAKSVNEVLTLHMGPEFILVTISIDFKDNLPVGEVENYIHQLDRQIKEKFVRVKRVFVEAEKQKI